MNKFSVGQKVKWTSQANGGWVTKEGVIKTVIPAGGRVYIAGSGFPRNHESYVVAVTVGKRIKREKLYWPRVSTLEAITGEAEC